MKVLALSPHTDDAELGCGGTLTRFVSEGAEVKCLIFSYADKEILKDEAEEALGILGVTDFQIFNFERRNFLQQRQEILQILYGYDKANHIDLVLTPSTVDLHQDHHVVTQETMRAFKRCTILGYELPWNNIQFTTNYFVRLQEADANKKIAALKCYDSQKNKHYFQEDFLLGLLKVRGTQIQAQYAEAFEVIRVVY
ncbi:PIG-L deacetylase family protein [Chloroflexota bacterium]